MRFAAGQPLSASLLRAIRDEVARLQRVSVGSGLEFYDGPDGRSLSRSRHRDEPSLIKVRSDWPGADAEVFPCWAFAADGTVDTTATTDLVGWALGVAAFSLWYAIPRPHAFADWWAIRRTGTTSGGTDYNLVLVQTLGTARGCWVDGPIV